MQWRTPRHWQHRGLIAILLYPLSLLFQGLVSLRRLAYSRGWCKSWKSPVPVVVVGNITAGGAGKTPLVIALAEHLRNRNLRVGIIVRGYGGSNVSPALVLAESDSAQVGDEALMLARRTGVSVVVGADRPSAVQLLLRADSVDVILCDDGLQHYALQRDIEIAVIDRDTRLGNGFFMPAGPLRESASRLQEVDLLVYSGGHDDHGGRTDELFGYELKIDSIVNVRDESKTIFPATLQQTVLHAVAAIAYPQKFFHTLKKAGLSIQQHEFPDHYQFSAEDLIFAGDQAVVMTEKDMVKCESWAGDNVWYVKVSASVDDCVLRKFDVLLDELNVRLN